MLNMEEALQQLIEISGNYGSKLDFTIAGGGNTSVKNDQVMYVKASGYALGTIDAEGFVALDRKILSEISLKSYSKDAGIREQQVKSDLLKSRIFPEKNQRPSVEASVHDAIKHKFVVHMHPTFVNGLMCSQDSKKACHQLFGNQMVYIDYITPGYILFKEIERQNDIYHKKFGEFPKVFFLGNHGIFVGAETTEEVRDLYDEIMAKLKISASIKPEIMLSPVDHKITRILPAVRSILSHDMLKIARFRNNNLIQKYTSSQEDFSKIAQPFTPDGIVYCNAEPLFVDHDGLEQDILKTFVAALDNYRKNHGFDPKVILIKNLGMVGIGESSSATEVTLDVFEDVMKIALLAENYSGPRPMSEDAIRFIENWEVEAYRKSLLAKGNRKRAENKVIVITGGGQGFGKGIAEGLMQEGANVVVVDVNAEIGQQAVDELNQKAQKNQAAFIKANITNAEDLQAAVFETVRFFGGVDVLISNAGVLRAGSLTELDEKDFDLVTNVNYKGFYLCTKYFSEPMKLQYEFNQKMFMDIIQINSKSGLQGSNKNFAYAGGKFGGIGLTQSFALELVPFNIKVNAICPGNYFEGPLWSDPGKGLFAQYLNARKVPGAQNIADVKKFYEAKVPMKRGCYPEDVVKSILYICDQEYETGQAIPVAGGQVMLN